jgi:hypothetical protein
MRTPIGTVEAEVAFSEHAGVLSGAAAGAGETVPLRSVVSTAGADGEHVTWSQSITRPMRLDLLFDVVVDGDELHGHSRAGRLPRSSVRGRRIEG